MHSPTLREPDGAIHWPTILEYLEGFRRTTIGRSFEDWKNGLKHIVFAIYAYPQYLRAIQGHSSGEELDDKLQNHQNSILMHRTQCHVGSSYDYSSIVEGGLHARGISNQNDSTFH